MYIIRINGPPGSGKSLLCYQIREKFPWVEVADTDDIADRIMSELLKNSSLSDDELHNKYAKLTLRELKKIAKGLDTLVIVGRTDFGFLKTVESKVHRYCLKASPKVMYRRLNMRHIDHLCSTRDNIERFLKGPVKYLNKVTKYKKEPLLCKYSDFVKSVKKLEKRCLSKGYKLMSSSRVLVDIQSYL